MSRILFSSGQASAHARALCSIILLAGVWGCTNAPAVQPPVAEQPMAAMDVPGDHTPGGIPIPASVRDNRGINFATVERRSIENTRRVPGQFELLPEARHEYRAPLRGRAMVHVKQFQSVQPGDLLYTLDAPDWRQLQHEAVEAEGDIVVAQAALEVAQARREESRSTLSRLEERQRNLAAVNVRRAELESQTADARNSLPRLDAEIRASEAALREAREHYESRLNTLASVTGLSVEELRAPQQGEAAWRAISALEIRTRAASVVENLAVNNGGWLEEGELAMTTADPAAIRFHAEAPQGDIALFRDGQRARIVPSQGGTVDLQETMEGELRMGLTAHEADRTISLNVTPDSLAPWARAGISGFLEVAVGSEPKVGLAIPMSAVVQDGLNFVFFRRDPKNPDYALRVVADLGENDGRWVQVKSGLKEGDEVVLDGVYALKLGSGSAQQQAPAGYHYHADGALHKDH